jgi:protein required for attachment to host cells
MLTKIDIKHKKVINHNGQNITIIERPKGLGDSIEKLLHTGMIGKIVHKLTGHNKPCGGCQKRKEKLNNIITYKEN